jgi:hypothetical protein
LLRLDSSSQTKSTNRPPKTKRLFGDSLVDLDCEKM